MDKDSRTEFMRNSTPILCANFRFPKVKQSKKILFDGNLEKNLTLTWRLISWKDIEIHFQKHILLSFCRKYFSSFHKLKPMPHILTRACNSSKKSVSNVSQPMETRLLWSNFKNRLHIAVFQLLIVSDKTVFFSIPKNTETSDICKGAPVVCS